jgi:hypothetical protein
LLTLVGWAVSSPAGAQWWGWGNHTSTVQEGYGRGLGDVISAQGDYNLKTSQAAINAEEATRRDIENRQLWTEAYYQMRRANRAFVAEERGRRPTMEDVVRYAQMGMPKRLSPKEFDYVTGKITWPKIFDEKKEFNDDRTKLQQLFAKRAQMGGVTFDEQMEIRRSTNAMLAQLKMWVRDLPADYYVGAKHFLESLAYELQLPPNG